MKKIVPIQDLQETQKLFDDMLANLIDEISILVLQNTRTRLSEIVLEDLHKTYTFETPSGTVIVREKV